MPELSYHFGITWADIYEMPAYELDAYSEQLDNIRRDLAKQSR